MKNILYRVFYIQNHTILKHVIRMMKLQFVLLFMCCVGLYATNAHSQEMKITIVTTNSTVKEILQEIEEKTDCFFLYNKEDVDVNRKTSVQATGKTVSDILSQVFADTDVIYITEGSNIVLMKKNILQQTPTLRRITGRISDEKGEPVIGVNVVEKGTTNGTITDVDGNFSLNINEGAILQVSYIGYLAQEIEVGAGTTVNITMRDDTQALEEVVVVGYGTARKSDFTGSVSKAKLERFENIASNNILERIKGSIPGLNIDGTNTAGQVAGMVIRGQNSTAASNTPLVVLDGVIFQRSIADIPANDIESVSVLKDISAVAIYGSRASNGVIMIETKKGGGINGKPKFEVTFDYGLTKEQKRPEMYDAQSYLQRILDRESYYTPGLTIEDAVDFMEEEEYKNYYATPNHDPTLKDPYGVVGRLGNKMVTSLSISNSLEKMKYYMSASIEQQKGVVLNDDYKRISGILNMDTDLTSWFSVSVNNIYTLRDYSGSSPSLGQVIQLSPYASLYNEDGSYRRYPQNWSAVVNPFWTIATNDVDYQNALNSIVTGRIKVPWIEGLTYTVTYSNSLYWQERNTFFNDKTNDGFSVRGRGSRAYNRNYDMLFDNLIKFNRIFADKHLVDVSLLYSREKGSWENQAANAQGFDNMNLGDYSLESGSIQTVSTGGGEKSGISLMGRLSYTFDNRYSITGTIRRDGYSAFSKNKKWGNFPSVGVRWNIYQEDFIKDNEVIDNLGLRASYGSAGNQSISSYGSLAKVSQSQYVFYGASSYSITQYISSLQNNDLGWESTTGLNVGVDFSLFKRINGSIDVYNTRTNNLMFNLSLPYISGSGSILSNIGEIRNRGVDIGLNFTVIDNRDFKWYSDFAFSLNRNKVQTILGEDNDGDGKEDDLISSGYFIGRSLGTIYDYNVLGLYQLSDREAGTLMAGYDAGYYKLEDVNNDGTISSDQDRQFVGNRKENFRWSWTNTFEYKDFSLMMYFYSIWGGNNWYLSANNTPYKSWSSKSINANGAVFDYWTPDNPGAWFPMLDYNIKSPVVATRYMDRSFIKLQKISLAYDASKWVSPWGINNLKVVLSADNLFTYAPDWQGLDPETDQGLAGGARPSMRTFLMSLKFNF
jgi:TonB-linked SusC/RagA family outer membrane protein